MNEHGYPCQCGRRFGGPIDAAYHLFWALEDRHSREHRCGGSYESVRDPIVGLHPVPLTGARQGYSEAEQKTYPIGVYTLKYQDLTTNNTRVRVGSDEIPPDPNALMFIDRNSKDPKGSAEDTWHAQRVLGMKEVCHLLLSMLGIEKDTIVQRMSPMRSVCFPMAHTPRVLAHYTEGDSNGRVSYVQAWPLTGICKTQHRLLMVED